MKIGILYLCTGKYTVFWPEFYKKFEKNFLPGCPKTDLVFTDAPQIAHEAEPNVRRIKQEALPWPYSTMERFRIFLTREQELREFDYLFYANANL
ncbi:glycosyl transferase, partial [bacterium]|nr:glycosyl transferase [bacterium]